ncbi:MAG: DUF2116 family Zn-ribbon domain-containing protein [Methanobacteriaceae archaeon]|jgi:predicted nucleic acid-binding Zn ribbon protein|nr:DUF2116 family Zn-ribbon domain-containing protein [Methanobacteriaceae archaeon]
MIETHKHCPICGVPIPLKEKVCSPDCEKVYNQRIAQSKKSRMILFALIIIFVLVWIFVTFLN